MIKTLENPLSNKLFKWLLLIALVLVIATLGLFWFGKPSFSEKDVVLLVEGPPQALSGDEAVYKLSYRNNSKLMLKDVKFRFSYPSESVVLRDGKPTDDSFEEFSISSLPPGESGMREFTAFLVGDKGSVKETRATITFSAGNLRSSFEKSVSATTLITDLPIALTLVAPPTATSGQDVTYIIDYRNERDEDASDLLLDVELPDGFLLQNTNPEPREGTTWSIPFIRSGTGGRIVINGILTGNERDSKSIEVTLKRKINEDYIDYEKAVSWTIISPSVIGVDVLVNGTRDYSAAVGEKLQYEITYKNHFNQSLLGLTLSVKLEGDMFDFATLETGGGYFDGQRKTLIYNAGSVPDFASLAPSKEGKLRFSVRLKSTFTSGISSSRSFFVRAIATLSTPNVPTKLDVPEVSVQSGITTKISTQPTLTQLVYFNDPIYGASGPAPLEVGKETVFTVHWQFTNPGNDITKARVTATLPTGVIWKGETISMEGTPEPIFNVNRSEVVWELETVPNGVGIRTPKYEGVFRVSVTPSINQQRRTITLLKDAIFMGEDVFTKASIVSPAKDASTGFTIDGRSSDGTVK